MKVTDFVWRLSIVRSSGHGCGQAYRQRHLWTRQVPSGDDVAYRSRSALPLAATAVVRGTCTSDERPIRSLRADGCDPSDDVGAAAVQLLRIGTPSFICGTSSVTGAPARRTPAPPHRRSRFGGACTPPHHRPASSWTVLPHGPVHRPGSRGRRNTEPRAAARRAPFRQDRSCRTCGVHGEGRDSRTATAGTCTGGAGSSSRAPSRIALLLRHEQHGRAGGRRKPVVGRQNGRAVT